MKLNSFLHLSNPWPILPALTNSPLRFIKIYEIKENESWIWQKTKIYFERMTACWITICFFRPNVEFLTRSEVNYCWKPSILKYLLWNSTLSVIFFLLIWENCSLRTIFIINWLINCYAEQLSQIIWDDSGSYLS